MTIPLLTSGIFHLQGKFTSGQQAVCYSEEWLRNDFKFQFRGWWGSWRWYHRETSHSEVQLHQNWWAWTICQCQEAYRYVPYLKFMLLGISSSLVPFWVLKDVHLPVRFCRCDWGCSQRSTLNVHSSKDNQRGDTQAWSYHCRPKVCHPYTANQIPIGNLWFSVVEAVLRWNSKWRFCVLQPKDSSDHSLERFGNQGRGYAIRHLKWCTNSGGQSTSCWRLSRLVLFFERSPLWSEVVWVMRGDLVGLPYACKFSETFLSLTFWECLAGVSLNTTINTAVSINPEIAEADTLRAWLVIDTLHPVPLSMQFIPTDILVFIIWVAILWSTIYWCKSCTIHLRYQWLILLLRVGHGQVWPVWEECLDGFSRSQPSWRAYSSGFTQQLCRSCCAFRDHRTICRWREGKHMILCHGAKIQMETISGQCGVHVLQGLKLQSVKYNVNVNPSSSHSKGTFPFCSRLISMWGPTSAISNQIKLCGTWHAQRAIAKLPKKVAQAIGVKAVRSISTVAIAGRWSKLFGPVASCMETTFLLQKVLREMYGLPLQIHHAGQDVRFFWGGLDLSVQRTSRESTWSKRWRSGHH